MRIPHLLGLLAILGCNIAGGAEDSASPTSIVPFETVLVDSVIDGDSFRTADEEFRLFGVNAPERGECFGDESHQWLTDWILDQSVSVEPQGFDQFDRIVANVDVGSTSINHEATATGHAFALSNTRVTLVEGEIAAMESGLGLWATDVCGASGPKAEMSVEEVIYNPAGPDASELVVIRNFSDTEIDLTGFVLRDESSQNRFHFPPLTLPAGHKVRVTTGCAGGGEILAWCTDTPVWNNDGDAVILLDGFGRVVAFHRY